MIYTIETGEGTLSIEKHVIGKIIIEEVKKFNDKIRISNHKGKVPGLVSKLGVGDDINHLEITMGPKGLDIRIYIVIHFGTSIGTITNQLIDGIQEKLKDLLDIDANSVAVIVTGIQSVSKNMAKRNIEVKR